MTEEDRAHALEQLGRILPQLGDEEVVVLAHLAKRALVGQERYGRLDLATDKRDWRRERSEEGQDWLFYSVFDDVKREILARPKPHVVVRADEASAE